MSLSLCTSELIEDDGSELGSAILETTLDHTCHVMLHSQLKKEGGERVSEWSGETVRGEEGDGGEGRRYLVEKGGKVLTSWTCPVMASTSSANNWLLSSASKVCLKASGSGEREKESLVIATSTS